MGAPSCIRVEVSDGVGTLTIDRRQRFNSFDVETARDFRKAGLGLARDETVRCVILRGRDGVFCSGADLKYIRGGGDGRTGMRGFKEKTFSDRLQEAADAKKAALERFKARPDPNDPEVVKRREERLRIAQAREEREAVRKAQKEEEARVRAEQEAVERAEREARERKEAIEKLIRDAADAAERKAARDARYAARKARQGGKKRAG